MVQSRRKSKQISRIIAFCEAKLQANAPENLAELARVTKPTLILVWTRRRKASSTILRHTEIEVTKNRGDFPLIYWLAKSLSLSIETLVYKTLSLLWSPPFRVALRKYSFGGIPIFDQKCLVNLYLEINQNCANRPWSVLNMQTILYRDQTLPLQNVMLRRGFTGQEWSGAAIGKTI